MSSILTNTGAMVALQTLKGVNVNMATTQNEISTGKSVSSAKDNSAVWAISKVMEADVNGFKAISDSLALGESTVAVARQASETVTDLLTDIKGKIVAAQEENVDRTKIQTDISALRDQITAVVSAAQFNGLNLIQGTEDVDILSSLDRSADGSVAATNITISRQDQSTAAGTYGSGTDISANAVIADSASAVASSANTAIVSYANTWAANDTATLTVAGVELSFTATGAAVADVASFFEGAINGLGLDGVTASSSGGDLTISSTRAFEDLSVTSASSTAGDGDALITSLNGTGSLTLSTGDISKRAEQIDMSTAAAVSEGDSYKVTVGSNSYNYIAGKGESMEDVAKGLKTAIDGGSIAGVTTKVVQDATTKQWSVQIDNDGTGSTSLALSTAANQDGKASGGLFGLDKIDVRTDAGASSALDSIETLIQSSIDAGANFGSAQARIENQSDFISKLTDSLKSGIGTLVDADMEEVSARLTALQTQQQLAVQSLSIANQAPQSILSLFR
ncbi:flagellin [Halocynthiibacter sp. C4]|uniref:flagellin n=1 Tax=Halocynthiibacter sp. C4 TaxID=2992758 RepID=UPI00237BADEE|nr:flagellin [Halocynthiibacter sp. C4]MDE0591364.1 flagellin [Halocynthiibacter sp. C4]